MSRSIRLDLAALDEPTSVFRIEPGDRVVEREGPRLVLPRLTTSIDLESGLPCPEPAPIEGLPHLRFHRAAEALVEDRCGIFVGADSVRMVMHFFAADVAMSATVLRRGGDALLTDEKITLEIDGRGDVVEARFRGGIGPGHELSTVGWLFVRRMLDSIGQNSLLFNQLEDQ